MTLNLLTQYAVIAALAIGSAWRVLYMLAPTACAALIEKCFARLPYRPSRHPHSTPRSDETKQSPATTRLRARRITLNPGNPGCGACQGCGQSGPREPLRTLRTSGPSHGDQLAREQPFK